tara:strand:+ start:482 stop:682 length:201 start_codon:yes stop_codon:yes gene_type:complete
MARYIYTVEDFEERLSELTIGTESVQDIMEFVRRLDDRYKWQSKRCDVAANLLGHDMINECMMEEQ